MNSSTADTGERSIRPAARAMLLTMLWDIGLPVIGYFLAELAGLSTYAALLTGTVVSALRMGWVGFRERRLDVFATFLLILFSAGFVLSFITGDVRFLLAKDSTTSATAGVVLLVSCLIGRPMAYYAAKRFAGRAGQEEFQSTAHTAVMRRRWYLVSLVWGGGLLTEATLRIVSIYVLPLNIAANVSQALMVVAFGLLTTWSVCTAKQGKSASS